MGMTLHVPRFTIEMLDDFPDDGTRYELLEGILLVTPAPTHAHQVVATRLATLLSIALAPSGLARVVAVGAIQRGERTQLQPDVLVCPASFPPSANWRTIRGAGASRGRSHGILRRSVQTSSLISTKCSWRFARQSKTEREGQLFFRATEAL